MTLAAIWFVLIFVLLAGYAVLDGFDLGVGVLHLFARNEQERRVSINSIGPVWDGNEVWLLAGGGALFAAFPPVYATVFSGFYLALMVLLVALVFRGISMEFRGKVASAGWARFWDWGFGLGSLLPPILLGVAFGNILRGLPLDAERQYAGSFLDLLNPFSLLVGVVTLVVFTLHGAIWLAMKTDGPQQARAGKVIAPLWWILLVLYALATFYGAVVAPFLYADVFATPASWVFIGLIGLGLLATRQLACGSRARYGWAFIASSITIAAMIGVAALSLFPRLVPMIDDGALDLSLTIDNSSSTDPTLRTMLIIALIGMPLVLLYTAFIYWTFRGKVALHEESY